MYGYSSSSSSGNELSYAYSADFLGHFPLPDVTPPSTFPSALLPSPLVIPVNEFEPVPALKLDFGHPTSSGCSSCYGGSPSSLGTQTTSDYMQRSVSSHSLQYKNVSGFHQLVSSPTELLDSDTSPVRKVFSTGDLQRINMMQHNHRSESPLSNESSIIEGMNKACRYSPEEKKERIERYRSKRNQRNFNKKIKYECRKTLADSRPRIRGRFARNDETEKAPQGQWSHGTGGDDYEEDDDDDNWIHFLNAFSANLIP